MGRRGIFISYCLLLVTAFPASAQNVVVNPGFQVQEGNGLCLGIGGGLVNCPSGSPDHWRAFALGVDSSIDLEILELPADDLYPGSPETNAVLLRLNGAGDGHGFDDFPFGAVPLGQGLDHHAEFYVKSGNADSADQSFYLNFPLFDAALNFVGQAPGSVFDGKATGDWQLISGPVFRPEAPVTQGFIGWGCIQDGDEDAILIALPSVTAAGVQVLPTNLACAKDGSAVSLTWTNNAANASLKVLRDGVEIASLAVDATSYVDAAVPVGDHTYQLVATVGAESGGPSCVVTIFSPPAAGDSVSVDVGATDVEDGLQNSVREEFFDGESEAVTCGPEGDLRDARLNYANQDPTPDTADEFYYFTVTDPRMKEQRTFHLALEVFDDPLFAGLDLYLQWTHRQSTGVADFDNTFFPPHGAPKHQLTGSGKWVTASWFIDNAGFRTFQLGRADFRVGVTGGQRVCLDRARLTYFPAPSALGCKARAKDVELSWTSPAAYDGIRILRDGAEIASLPGDASSYTDASVADGEHTYQVQVTLGGITGGPSCTVTVYSVAPGTTVSVDLGDVDAEVGLANVLRDDPSDGENEPTACGPGGDRREGRSNLAGDDPTPDAADAMYYFLVVDPGVKSQPEFVLKATVYDDPARAGAPVALQYTVAAATGPDDLANTFFPLENPPARTLTGSGEWITLEWEATDACFRSFQQGVADFRLLVTDGGRICIDRVELIVPEEPPPPGPVFHRGDSNNDGTHNISDPVNTLNVLFLGTGAIPCQDAADSNDDGQVNISDPVNSLNVLFLGTGNVPPPLPPEAGQPCGEDPEDEVPELGCAVYTRC